MLTLFCSVEIQNYRSVKLSPFFVQENDENKMVCLVITSLL
jgi:hypothetical protein